MRLFVLPEYPPESGGGIATFYGALLPALVRQGHAVHTLVGSAFTHGGALYEHDGMTAERLETGRTERLMPAFSRYAALPELQRHLAASRALWEQARGGDAFDAVEVVDWGMLFAPWTAGAGPPAVVQLHGSSGQIGEYDTFPGMEPTGQTVRLLEAGLLPHADALHTHSRANGAFWTAQTGRDVTVSPPLPPAAHVARRANGSPRPVPAAGPRLLCVGAPPADWPGTPVILHRHLSRFARDGWTVGYAASVHDLEGWADPPAAWDSFPIPMRRPWWPPHRDGVAGSHALRRWLAGADLARRVRPWRPDVVLSVLSPDHVHVAAAVARRCGCPLAVILHDQVELWEQFRDRPHRQAQIRRDLVAVLGQADRVYPVTEALAAAYGPAVAARAHPLLPIPPVHAAPCVQWREAFARPHLVIAGSLHPFQIPTLDALARELAPVGGRLTAITHNSHEPFDALVREHAHLTLRPAFPTSAEARVFCAEHASALLASYAFEDQPWAATSFPSRLVEGVQLGLPVWLIAPPDTAASQWARTSGWTAHTETLDAAALAAEIAALASPDGWARRAADARRAAETEFDPDAIHAGFAADLRHLIEARA